MNKEKAPCLGAFFINYLLLRAFFVQEGTLLGHFGLMAWLREAVRYRPCLPSHLCQVRQVLLQLWGLALIVVLVGQGPAEPQQALAVRGQWIMSSHMQGL